MALAKALWDNGGMWRIFDNPRWKNYKEIAAIRGLLQWVGVFGLIMDALYAIGAFLWVQYQGLPVFMRIAAGLIAILAVSGTFAFIKYLFGSDPPPPVPTKSKIVNKHNEPFIIQPQAVKSRRNLARAVSVGVIVLVAA